VPFVRCTRKNSSFIDGELGCESHPLRDVYCRDEATGPQARALVTSTRGNTMIRNRLSRVAVALTGSMITLFASAGIAAADESACVSPRIPRTSKIEKVKLSHSYDNFDHGSEWKISGYGPGKLALSRTVESSNSFSVSADISASVISAAVGFDVTESVSYTASFEFEMPAEPRGYKWILEAGTRDDVYIYDVQKYCGFTRDGAPTRGEARKTGHLISEHGSERPGNPRD
jgi:hypothetical protein